jgi:hypothetical protein
MDFFQDTCVSSYLNRPIWREKRLSTRWNIEIVGHIPFKHYTIFTGNQWANAPASKTDGFLQEIHLFLHFSRRGLFEAKWAFLYLENYDLQEVFLSTNNSFLPGIQCATAAFSNGDCFLWRGACVSSTQLNRPMLSNKTLSPPGYS